jgi:hypothetical protein
MLREGSGNMHHALLVLRSIKAQPAFVRKLDDSLTEARNIAMSKNSPNALNEPILAPIALRILVRNKLHDCLSNRKTDRFTHNSIIRLDRSFLGESRLAKNIS